MFKKLLVLALAASFSLPALAADGSAKTGVLNGYMEQRNQVIAQRYQQAVKPAAQQNLSLSV